MAYRGFGSAVLLVLMMAILVMSAGCSSKPNPELNLGGIDYEEVFEGVVARVYRVIGGVNRPGDLGGAVAELELVSMDFDDLVFNSEKLSADGKAALSDLALKAAPEMELLVERVKESPVMERELGGVLKGIFGKLKRLI